MIESLSGIAKTAYYCCGVRWADAQRQQPICGDYLAEVFMNEEARQVFRRFEDLRMPNIASATRARIIDDWLRDRLLADPEQLIILLGAGFDSRAYRLPGGKWVEIDEPALIAEKEAILPALRAPHPLMRIPLDFARERIEKKLAAWRGGNPVIVMEGVSMYLPETQLTATLSALRQVFPRHTLICDLMTRHFAETYGKTVRTRIAELGGTFTGLRNDPARFIEGRGYAQVARLSIMGRARELRAVPVPKFLLATLLRPLRDGYCTYVFETGAAP